MPAEATETPLPPGATTEPPEPAVPSNPGDPGPAVNLTGDPGRGKPLFGAYCAACHGPEGILGYPNPGTDDGSVPPLNPIDETIANADPKTFFTNIDLFVEHGSVPGGDSPAADHAQLWRRQAAHPAADRRYYSVRDSNQYAEIIR